MGIKSVLATVRWRGTSIAGRRYSADGQTVGNSEFQVNTNTQNNQDSPAVTTLAKGGFVVVWKSHDPKYNVSNGGIAARKYEFTDTLIVDVLGRHENNSDLTVTSARVYSPNLNVGIISNKVVLRVGTHFTEPGQNEAIDVMVLYSIQDKAGQSYSYAVKITVTGRDN